MRRDMRALVLATLVASGSALAAEAPPGEYVPAPAKDIPGYSEKKLPCDVEAGWKTTDGRFVPSKRIEDEDYDGPTDTFNPPPGSEHTYVICYGTPNLPELSLRELAILRNTIHARYGWAGFRKAWLREHFQKQPWYKPDPRFSIKRLSAVDRQNAALIAQAELSFRYVDLEKKRDAVLARAGQYWGDLPSFEGKDGETVYACDIIHYKGSRPTKVTREYTENDETTEVKVDADWVVAFEQAAAQSKDCIYNGVMTKETNEASEPDLSQLSAEDRIELGLISRAMGDFATDSGLLAWGASSLDAVLPVAELRQLSLRDLRLLRNIIYARRGRPFKSKLLQEHFARMPWYKPDPAYTDKRLTKNDQRNVALIAQVEKEFGGALVDKDFQAANPSRSTDVAPPIPYEGTA